MKPSTFLKLSCLAILFQLHGGATAADDQTYSVARDVRSISSPEGHSIALIIYRPANLPDPAPAVLYMHGGGYVIGSPRSHRHLAADIALAAGTRAFTAGLDLKEIGAGNGC